MSEISFSFSTNFLCIVRYAEKKNGINEKLKEKQPRFNCTNENAIICRYSARYSDFFMSLHEIS